MYGCSQPKTVLICGDHECVNKDEAKQYFEENLTLEVKIINDKNLSNVDLVELNLENDNGNERKIRIAEKKKTKQKIKKLSKVEIKETKLKVRKKNINRKQKTIIEKKTSKKVVKNKSNKIKKVKSSEKLKVANKSQKDILDVCVIIDKCNIDEITKYLVKQGKERRFPNITEREK